MICGAARPAAPECDGGTGGAGNAPRPPPQPAKANRRRGREGLARPRPMMCLCRSHRRLLKAPANAAPSDAAPRPLAARNDRPRGHLIYQFANSAVNHGAARLLRQCAGQTNFRLRKARGNIRISRRRLNYMPAPDWNAGQRAGGYDFLRCFGFVASASLAREQNLGCRHRADTRTIKLKHRQERRRPFRRRKSDGSAHQRNDAPRLVFSQAPQSVIITMFVGFAAA